jgi:hypothetical protein
VTRPTPSHTSPTFTPPAHLVEAIEAVGWRLDSVRPLIAGGILRWAARIEPVPAAPASGWRHVAADPLVALDEITRYLLADLDALTADSITVPQIVDLDGEVNHALVAGGLTPDLAIQGELCRAALSATEPGRRVARWKLATILNRRARAAVAELEVTAETITDKQIRELGAASAKRGDFLTAMWCDYALATADGSVDVPAGCEAAAARARCAAAYNARRRGGRP